MARHDDRPAILFGSSWPSLTAAYALAAQGVEIWVCAPSRFPAAYLRGARYVAVPDPAYDEAGAIEALCGLANRLAAPPVIVPGTDRFAQALARHRDRLDRHSACCVTDAETADRVIDKRRFALWAGRHAPSYPTAVTASHFRPGHEVPFPVAARPAFTDWSDIAAYGHPPAPTLRGIGLTVLEDATAWEAYRQKWGALLPFILVQGYVQGDTRDMYSIGLYADRAATINALFVSRKLRGYPPHYGDATACRNDHVPATVISEVEDIVARLRLQGIMEFEYKRDPASGQFRLLEINLRPWVLIGGSAASPANIPYAAYRDLCGRPLAPVRTNDPVARVTYCLLFDDLLVATVLGRRFDRAYGWSPLAWWKSLRAERTIFLDFNRYTWPVGFRHIFGQLFRWLTKDRLQSLRHLAGPANGMGVFLDRLKQSFFDRHLIRFDRRHDIETAYPVPLAGLTIDSPRMAQGQPYRAVPESVFAAAVSALPPDLSRFTFVDFGAGKGRALILAARAGFGRVVGVEFAAELFAVATVNIARFKAREGAVAIDCRLGDAVEFPIPDGPVVFFFHNPFDKPVMEQVMSNIRTAYEREPRDMFVLYAKPVSASAIERQGIFRRLARVRPRPLLRHRRHYETVIYATGRDVG